MVDDTDWTENRRQKIGGDCEHPLTLPPPEIRTPRPNSASKPKAEAVWSSSFLVEANT